MSKKPFPVLFIFIVLAFFAVGVTAQDGPPPDGNGPAEGRPDLFSQLGLSPEQIGQIRRINADRKPVMQEAQRRMREANRALDVAIYADAVNEGAVQTRLAEFQGAQAAVVKERFTSELLVRKVLTLEQLVKFREIRSRFTQARENLQKQQRERRRRPGPGARRQPPNF
ncbi:MAG: periplasmic heavy metal sensor [Acidobacteriota bacterium]